MWFIETCSNPSQFFCRLAHLEVFHHPRAAIGILGPGEVPVHLPLQLVTTVVSGSPPRLRNQSHQVHFFFPFLRISRIFVEERPRIFHSDLKSQKSPLAHFSKYLGTSFFWGVRMGCQGPGCGNGFHLRQHVQGLGIGPLIPLGSVQLRQGGQIRETSHL